MPQDPPHNSHWKDYCANVPQKPGIYQFLNQRGKILYVGKAKNLRNRLNSWLLRPALNRKHQVLLAHLSSVEFTTTGNEVEALLLENNLIKEHQPTYNVLLKDQKSYPYIRISSGHDFPGVYFYRGVRNKPDEYFGPYPDSRSVRKVVKLIYKLFRLRQCTDTVYATRTRPCVQYQLGNCDAPCVGYIDQEKYRNSLRQCRLFLKGRRKRVIAELSQEMEEHARQLNFEEAARCRDRLEAIRVINTEQVAISDTQNADFIVAGNGAGGQALVQVLSIRGGINLGISSKILKCGIQEDVPEMIRLFVMQHYRRQEPPDMLVTEHSIDDAANIGSLLRQYHPELNHKVQIFSGQKSSGKYERWLQMARANLSEKLSSLDIKASMYHQAFKELSAYLPIDNIGRIDCMDVSHLMGQNTVCSSVSCDQSGLRRDLYRLYNLELETAGDDLAALTQALTRKLKSVNLERDGLPDVLLIDGGIYQWRATHRVLERLGLTDRVQLLAISKHDNRKLGMEYLHFDDQRWMTVRQLSRPLFRCLLSLRNEAHRFAIGAHRAQRNKRTVRSQLDGIPSVGPQRRRALLNYFRDAAAVQGASIAELCKIPGISSGVARQIHAHFHSQNLPVEASKE